MIRARKQFGQHFLVTAWADKVIRAIDPKPDETFLEIGPGRGAITRPLASRARAVVAFEIDRDLAADLQREALGGLTVIQADFLQTDPGLSLAPKPLPASIRVAGNLPYNVASPIMFRLVEVHDALAGEGVSVTDATLMLQREVAQRLAAGPGTKEYGVLSVLMQHRARVDTLLKLPPGAFRPAPKVDSALVRLRYHPPDPPVRDAVLFESLVKGAFAQRRKTLANALRAWASDPCRIQALEEAGRLIDLGRRPETVTVAEFAQLADVFSRR